MKLTFLGAVGTVTGSRFAVSTPAGTVLVDCGLFQGPRQIRERNWADFPLNPADISAVVLTHAHLDHCGYVPALVRDGFTGPIYCSPNTARLVPIILRDSAKLQEEDTAYARRKGFSRHAEPRPLYDSVDAEAAIGLLVPRDFGDDFAVLDDLRCVLYPAGHILGSSTTTLTQTTPEGQRRLVFSGDLGRGNHPLLDPPTPPVDADAIVIESTYGDRDHADFDAEIDEMATVISRTLKRGGTVVIPAFAVDRTEVLLIALRRLIDQHRIPLAPIHIDSPMALAALDIYREAVENADSELTTSAIAEGTDLIDLPTLRAARTPEDSKKLDAGHSQIIISASGMGTGGRVTHHLKAFLPDPKSSVLLVGYQAAGTPGRMLADGAEQIKIHGHYVPVRAEIAQIDAFSVHADRSELLAWIESDRSTPEQIFIVHGEPDAAAALADQLREELQTAVVVPEPNETVAI